MRSLTKARREAHGFISTFVSDESGQSTTEFVLLIGLFSIPTFILVRKFMDLFVGRFLTAMVESLTRR